MTVEQAADKASELREEERAGWPKGFDQKAIGKRWDEIFWTLDSAYETIAATAPELAPVVKRQYLRLIDPTWGNR